VSPFVSKLRVVIERLFGIIKMRSTFLGGQNLVSQRKLVLDMLTIHCGLINRKIDRDGGLANE